MANSKLWEKQFLASVAEIRHDLPYEESANQLRKLIQSGLLSFTDITNNPERFFLAHRLLAKRATVVGPGFWIRFTVQYNLFAGTVAGVGGPDQVDTLQTMEKAGTLGCFGLTERLAGVNSGLVVKTIATWDPERNMFCLEASSSGAYKNWISQGLTADMSIVVADLRVGGRSRGPHAFLMEFRRNSKVVEGIELGDMGIKTTGNDLDNAWIRFDRVYLPKSALLNRYADIVDNEYVQKTPGIRAMSMIGQRLYTGRVAVAQASIIFTQTLFKQTKNYSDNKNCWSPQGNVPLTSIPQLSALYVEAEQKLSELEKFLRVVEGKLCQCLRSSEIPGVALVRAIAVAKVLAVETAIQFCFRLKQEVGSYALMSGTGFEHTDFLQCCKFAEGDSRILMQKMARDRMKAFSKSDKLVEDQETVKCASLLAGLEANPSISKQQAWDANWEKVYALAASTMDTVMDKFRNAKL